MGYVNRDLDVVSEKLLITAYEAGRLIGIGRDEVRKMALQDLENRGLTSYAVPVGKSRIYIKRIQFLKEVGGNV